MAKEISEDISEEVREAHRLALLTFEKGKMVFLKNKDWLYNEHRGELVAIVLEGFPHNIAPHFYFGKSLDDFEHTAKKDFPKERIYVTGIEADVGIPTLPFLFPQKYGLK